jgi:phosphatidylethanolamine-binding protein (PEBP) family uncharacterized protein
MKMFRGALVLFCALALGGGACSPAGQNGGPNPGRGGGGGDTGGTGGSVGTGGSGYGGSGGSGGTGGSVGGSGGSTGGSGGSSGAGGNSGAGGSSGADASTGGSGGGSPADASGDRPSGGGTLSIEVDSVPDPARMRLCFRPSATNDNGNHSPKIDWTGVPPEAKSLVLTTEDLTGTPVCHQIICNIPPTVTGNPADAKGMIPAGAEASYGHAGKTAWYGPGAGPPLRNYEIKIWALATPMFEGGCGGPPTSSRMHCARLKAMANDKTKVLATASKVLWGQRDGTGCP